MNASPGIVREIAEARATAIVLRASAKACGPEQGALKFRLTRAAEALNSLVLLVVRSLERIGGLEAKLRELGCDPGVQP
ncbi:hypothetical protein JM946_10595 [Steroidobacter sp. S1-65]|uniref:Uncharacterized protein n=1 Tax=Steroidobacter gossypii TaxID=2805490 RepID=A0ABS1WW72_9GAMM|nr:hypothetical protein [Steroidobacter gossypii]MBM0105203.1 hypothetical protein [Steroidobacter gossypii]